MAKIKKKTARKIKLDETTILIKKKTAMRIKALKLTRLETYNEILIRILDKVAKIK